MSSKSYWELARLWTRRMNGDELHCTAQSNLVLFLDHFHILPLVYIELITCQRLLRYRYSEMLLAAGADLHNADMSHNTPLKIAEKKGIYFRCQSIMCTTDNS